MTTVGDIIGELENIAPPELAEDGDRIGLQVGQRDAEVSRVCVSVDTSPPVIKRFLDEGGGMLVAHHPLIFRPLTSLAEDDPASRSVVSMIRANAALYVLHTNLDIVSGGINDCLAQVLGLADCSPLSVRHEDTFYKVAVFVPGEAVERVRNAMADAGAGRIGQYTHCSFRTQGVGSFVPLPAAEPYIGSVGKLEEVEEYRLEMICVGSWLELVISEMVDKHPYNEVAYDVYELANEPITYGLGRVGALEKETTLAEFAGRVNAVLHPAHLKVFGDPDAKIKRAAVCGGSGSSLFGEAAGAGADVYVTGDTKHHDILDANALGLAVIDAGHLETEIPGMIVLADKLRRFLADRGVAVDFLQ